ncbi:hypothetical protein GP486_004426 [Trichoglossum hirsutum]|uniref:DUF6697 domain-containing protein n=1 Tax=Trichoglossum hirsutum TaxID=265104 RepID=A0A9P8LB01_9PEZI|nr:hypothetical protein GP486_004426 [Trichoglossum hirsutum]
MQARELEAESPGYSCPLFLRDESGGDYMYYGNYREPRFSDRLDYSRMLDEVPESMKEYWAKALTAKKRPAWVTEVFIDEGLISKELVTVNGVVDNDLAAELAEHIKAEDVLKAFKTADAEDGPSMRLYWEYLECVGYEVELYEALAARKRWMVERLLERSEAPSP